ncbi:hypothetical protein CTEN210_17772 [Chaetoceros tenuissimus]|uniref:Uroporphyrinogen decarboxylase n=1 Tax=Chaetoceros tenuissimus TaxID=426638 RepID=A0AAD3DDH4_9STRA|nr:hypothetical protein CTEN210_17772 [Chaetoceros tenuissimus]
MKLSLTLSLFISAISASQGFAPVSSSIRQRSHLGLTTGPGGKPATSSEEDLALTRQIIMNQIAKEVGASTDSPATSDGPTYTMPAPPANDLMIRAALGREPVERTPIWLFRQAGRHLPEYKEHKEKTGRSFLDMLQYPEDVAECTLQPLRRYPVDAAILFSDILVIAEALNIEVTMPGGVGILVPNPLAGPEEIETRVPSLDEISPQFIQDKMGVILESVKLIRQKMKEEKIDIPLIGFSGAPFTLMFYMIGGSSRKNTDSGMKWLNEYPEQSQKLLDVLTKIITEYMSAQVEAGAHMLQLFEAMGMMLEEKEFYDFAMPCLEKIATALKSRYPDVPLMIFTRGACYANEKLSKMGFDVVTMDGDVDRSTARATVGDRCGLQGNYDPAELIEENGKTPETVKETAKALIDELGPQRLIANLGEGLGGKESTDLVQVFVDTIHEYSEAKIKESA